MRLVEDSRTLVNKCTRVQVVKGSGGKFSSRGKKVHSDPLAFIHCKDGSHSCRSNLLVPFVSAMSPVPCTHVSYGVHSCLHGMCHMECIVVYCVQACPMVQF